MAVFARNQLCALAREGLKVTPATLLDTLLDPAVRVGTSTPKADPSGDYAFALFAKAEAHKPGARAALEAKALQLTGGPTSEKAPAGRNQYGWVMESGKADVFLTYCTNAILARKEVASLQIVQIPPELNVGGGLRDDRAEGCATGDLRHTHAGAGYHSAQRGTAQALILVEASASGAATPWRSPQS